MHSKGTIHTEDKHSVDDRVQYDFLQIDKKPQ